MIFVVTKAEIRCEEKEALTSGMVKAIECRFVFNDDWDNLGKTAVFSCGCVTKDVMIIDNKAILPHELLISENIGQIVYVGVYGIDGEGNVIIPTVKCRAGLVKEGSDPTEDPDVDPTPTLFEQIMADNASTREQTAGNAKTAEDAAVISVESKEKAIDAKEAIMNMGAEVETLAEGSSAGVEKIVDPETGAVTLKFGIPIGATGKGISSVTLNADYTLTFRYTDGTSDTTGPVRGPKGDKGDTGNGIQDVNLNSDYTLSISFTDGTTVKVGPIRGAKGEKGDAGRGISSVTLNADYTLTFRYTDGTSETTGSVRGQKGDKGDTGDSVWYAFSSSSTGANFTTTWSKGQNYVGIGKGATRPTTAAGYTWYEAIDNTKADKAENPTEGHVAALDEDGNLVDNGNVYHPVPKDETMILRVGVDSDGKLWASGDSGSERFGVSGVGGSSPTLTRLWDAEGKTATPGTDQEAGHSDFDNYAPFNRRKCVGSWSIVDGKAIFNVQAYEGDADYAEDGSKGDYVAVDQPPVYWYEDKENDILGVSGNAHPGWNPHQACVDAEGNVRAHTYLPAYALALKDGHAVSLPGYHNYFGHYQGNWEAARTYGDGSTFVNHAIIEPSAVDHLEWLLQTIEFAPQNMQTVMEGATEMAYNAKHKITGAPAANKIVLTAAIGDLFVVGQTIYIGSAHDATPSGVDAYNCITAIENCDEDGTLNASGTYRLITYDGTDRTESITAGTTVVATRPWITGATQGYASGVPAVLGHTGSPVSNTDKKHPMLYRWRENVYGNQNMTCLDLMNRRIADGSSYHVSWYHNPELQHKGAAKYYPSSSSKPDATDLTSDSTGWEVLGVETPVSSYANGYIKEESADERWPHVRVPTLTKGGSATTYFCDYAFLVNSYAVRAVRRRGNVIYGAYYGPRYVDASAAPSYAHWAYGSGLYFVQ